MINRFLLFLICIVFVIHAQSQQRAERYKDLVFESVTFLPNQSYKAQEMAAAKKRDYLLDIYEPANDSELNRPVIIWLHGGGFKFGNKRARGIPIWAKSFAQRGYVSIAMNYRKSFGLPARNYNDMLEGCYSAMEDLGHVILWCKKNAGKLRIDTNKIIVAGNSAGSIVALQSAYTSLSEIAERRGKTATGKHQETINQNNIYAVVNFWGAIFDSSWLKNSEVPVVSVHGSRDGIVPYEFDEIPLYGSAVISRQADNFRIPNALKTYTGLRHELQQTFHPFIFGKKAKNRWLMAGQFAADFLSQQLHDPQKSHAGK